MQATNIPISEISKRMGNRKKKKKTHPNKYRDEDISKWSCFTAFSVFQVKHGRRGGERASELQ